MVRWRAGRTRHEPQQFVSFIWGVADLIRDTFKRGKYQDVILPLTVLRRLDCVLAPSKQKVLPSRPGSRASSATSTRSSGAARGSPSTTRRATTWRAARGRPHIAQNLRNYPADNQLFGQEVNRETFGIWQCDLFMKSEDGLDAGNVVFGSTVSNDRHAGGGFDYMIANARLLTARAGSATRTGCGTSTTGARPAASGGACTRISDGQLLFLLHMLAHVGSRAEGGSRVAIIMNGSPLFSGEAGSAGSEICRDRDGRPELDPRLARHRRRLVLRVRGEAPRFRECLDRQDTPRPACRRGRARRLLDQLQPLLLRATPGAADEEIEGDMRRVDKDIVAVLHGMSW